MSQLQTHPNFVSKVSFINNAQDIKNKLEIFSQYSFDKTSTFLEMENKKFKELQEIIIEAEKIDRVYDIEFHQNSIQTRLKLVVRMDYKNIKNEFLYAILNASKSNYGFQNGTIFVSKHPQLFVKHSSIRNFVKNFILKDKNISPHPNFISIVPFKISIEEIYDKLKIFQTSALTRTSTSRELKYYWEKLQKINININKMDRLYYFSFNRDITGYQFNLIVRIEYNKFESFYIKLSAFTNSSYENCRGEMFISKYIYQICKDKSIPYTVKNFIYGEFSSLAFISFAQTHPKFKSLMSSVTNSIDIYCKVGKALFYQENFPRETTPKEEKNWNFKKLQKINIIVEKIDYLYYIMFDRDDDDNTSYFVLIARMDYKNKPLYVQLNALLKDDDEDDDDVFHRGVITVSRDFNFFVKNICSHQIRDCIEKEKIVN